MNVWKYKNMINVMLISYQNLLNLEIQIQHLDTFRKKVTCYQIVINVLN